MVVTDGKKIVKITISSYSENTGWLDWTEDYFNAGCLGYNEETNCYIVDSVDYMIEQALSDLEYDDNTEVEIDEL